MKSTTHARNSRHIQRLVFACLGTLALLISPRPAFAQSLTIANPNWNITLTDFGYSDFLLDNTPGFQGREYLSGEWGAAVGYQISGGATVTPQWLEPHFVYPDWTTNHSAGATSCIYNGTVGRSAEACCCLSAPYACAPKALTIRSAFPESRFPAISHRRLSRHESV